LVKPVYIIYAWYQSHCIVYLLVIQDVVTVGDIKSVFNSSREWIGHRDCKVNGVSALKG